MTASAPSSPRPGRAASAGRPAGALLVLLLVTLLAALPCTGLAKADASARPAPDPVSAVSVVSAAEATAQSSHARDAARDAARASDHGHLRVSEQQDHWILCTADGQPPRNNGCSSHPFCPQDAQLPNPPPHPQPAAWPLASPAPEALPRVMPAGLLDGPHPAPDLHELQVHRS
ncbi:MULTISPECIES: hypothetical protein [Kitasatospora]|uniref:Secreted protein n=1 Tax=Kitasatospora cathayae TaxID=3004092 RepID=A0ABY7Q9V1_9ACTN|nr:hypothetical protein [Kitasatospora sp. HUAS 3-15]WBP89465.1 hypothetical protein O1G21_28940 [Kitasatospora sp. HUAS 3-15]